jgi:hypothetical protein
LAYVPEDLPQPYVNKGTFALRVDALRYRVIPCPRAPGKLKDKEN